MAANATLASLSLMFVLSLAACSNVAPQAARYQATTTRYIDTQTQGPVSGVGVESQDIDAMADKMARDLLATPEIAGRGTAPRIVLDDSDFQNRGSQAFDKGMITDSLRVRLNRAARGRMVFLDRQHMASVERERDLKRRGVTDVGTTGLTKAVAGADFKLTGSIRTLNAANNATGMRQRRTQVTFEMTDLESSAVIWSNDYTFQKAAADDITYQ